MLYPATNNLITVSTSKGRFLFAAHEIICCKASSNYTWFYLTGHRKLLVAKTMGQYETVLAENNFLRIHHTSIVNKQHIAGIEKCGAIRLSDGSCLTISRRRRSTIQKQLLVSNNRF